VAATIAAVTMSPPADGTEVTLPGVVVVGNELRATGAQVYVQDLGGGPYSGLLVYCGSSTCRTALERLQPGDIISVAGRLTAHKGGGGTTLELGDPLSIVWTGASAAPVAVDVPPELLAAAPDSAAFKPYNGVYVRVAAAEVISAHVPELDSGSCDTGKYF